MALPKPLRVGSAAALTLLLASCDDNTGPDACTIAVDYSIGEATGGSLSGSDCRLSDGSFADFYLFTVAPQASVRFTLSSAAFDAFLVLLGNGSADGPLVALNDDEDASTTNSAIHIILAAGDYVIAANSLFGNETGGYSLSSSDVAEENAGCAEVWVTRGIATADSIKATDCVETGPFYSDEFSVVLFQGQTLTVTMTSSEVDAYLELERGDGTVVDFDDDSAGGTNAQIVYSVPTSDFYTIVASTLDPDTTGAYALTIN